MHPGLNHQLQVARTAELRAAPSHPVSPEAQPARRRLRDLLGHARPAGVQTR